MKHVPLIAAILLGGIFIMSSSVVLFGLAPVPEIPKDTPVWHFMQASGNTGFLTLVKVLELLGGLLVVLPRTRNLGLLILGSIIVNILAFHQFIAGDGILQPMLIAISLLAVYLLWTERKAWAPLLSRTPR
jgi:putative oxidoreductase